MTNTPTLVLGGTGKTGRRVAAQLQARDVPVRAASRSSEQRFDWYDETTWEPALDGIEALYVVPMANADAVELTAAFTKLAAARRVDRVVLLSGRGVDRPGHEAGVFQAALAVEDAVRDCGAAWTILRPSWFMQNFSENYLLHSVLAGELRVPAGNGAEAFVDADDVAAVAVAALTEDSHTEQIYELSGPRTLSFGAAMTEIGDAIGRPIRYIALSPDDHVAELVEHGVPTAEAAVVGQLFEVIRLGLSDHVSDGVALALGRAPRDFADYARTTAATGVWTS